MKTKHWVSTGAVAIALFLLTFPARGFTAEQDEGAVSTASVARLKIVKGTAWVRTGDSGDWEESANNYTLAGRYRVSVPEGSEAEIQFHGSQSLKLRGGSEVEIRDLGEQKASYRLRSGQAEFSLPKDDFVPVRVTVPGNREVRVDAPGRYMFSTDRGTTTFLVRAGVGAVAGDKDKGAPVAVKAGEEASIGKDIRVSRVESGPPEMAPEEPPLTAEEEAAGIPPSAAGELRQYGEWVSTPEYGEVWRPYVEDGWEPYYYGRWDWVDPYGWTWVGYEPWGWWPYHTGWWWPSPVFGWVWCPFNSFVSVDFFFGGHSFHGHNARFFCGNVRFTGRGDFVRWVPARPGVIESRSGSFSRGDSRLARWDRPVERGSVMVRHNGGAPTAWEGRTGRTRGTVTGAGMARPRNDFRSGGSSVSGARGRGSSVSGGSGGGTVRGRQANYGTIPRASQRGGTRSSAYYGKGAPERYGQPVRPAAGYGPPSRSGGSSAREYSGSVAPRGYSGGDTPRGYSGSAAPRGYSGGGSSRGFMDGGSRGFGQGGSSRGFSGGGNRR